MVGNDDERELIDFDGSFTIHYRFSLGKSNAHSEKLTKMVQFRVLCLRLPSLNSILLASHFDELTPL